MKKPTYNKAWVRVIELEEKLQELSLARRDVLCREDYDDATAPQDVRFLANLLRRIEQEVADELYKVLPFHLSKDSE